MTGQELISTLHTTSFLGDIPEESKRHFGVSFLNEIRQAQAENRDPDFSTAITYINYV